MKGRAPANLLKRIIVENNSKLKINFIGHGSGTSVAIFLFSSFANIIYLYSHVRFG